MLLPLIASALLMTPAHPDEKPPVGSCLVKLDAKDGGRRYLHCRDATVQLILKMHNELSGMNVRIEGPCSLAYTGAFRWQRDAKNAALAMGPHLQEAGPDIYRCVDKPSAAEIAAWKRLLVEPKADR